MKITDIRTAIIAANFPWNLIRVYTDSGLVGLGEAYWGPGVTDVVEKLKPRLLGEDPMEVDRLWTRMMRLMSGPGSIAGTTVAAISGIEIALLDLVGKHLKTPVYQLLGGKFRNRIRIYADSHAETLRDIDAWQERALQVRERGFDAIKLEIAGYDPNTNRQTGHANAWLDVDDVRLLSYLVCQRSFAAVTGGRWEKYGGSLRDDGKMESRTLAVEWDQGEGGKFARFPYRITVANGPGRKTATGGVSPDGPATSQLSMRLPETDMIKVMLALVTVASGAAASGRGCPTA